MHPHLFPDYMPPAEPPVDPNAPAEPSRGRGRPSGKRKAARAREPEVEESIDYSSMIDISMLAGRLGEPQPLL